MEKPIKKDRIVFQGAIEVWLDEDRNWKRLNPFGDIVDADPSELKDQHGLLPIQYTGGFPCDKPILLSPNLTDEKWRCVSHGWVATNDLNDALVLHRYNDWRLQNELGRIQKMIYNAHYHMKNLIRVCLERLEGSAKDTKISQMQGINLDPNSMTGNWFDPFYEIEATISTVVRSFELMRYTLWYLYSEKKEECPSDFKSFYRGCVGMPQSLRERINQCWKDHLMKAKEYRNCIVHHTTIDALGGRAYIRESPKDCLSLCIPIPENPESKSTESFTYSKDLDGLDYCWRLVNQLVEVSTAIVADVEKPPPAATNLCLELVR